MRHIAGLICVLCWTAIIASPSESNPARVIRVEAQIDPKARDILRSLPFNKRSAVRLPTGGWIIAFSSDDDPEFKKQVVCLTSDGKMKSSIQIDTPPLIDLGLCLGESPRQVNLVVLIGSYTVQLHQLEIENHSITRRKSSRALIYICRRFTNKVSGVAVTRCAGELYLQMLIYNIVRKGDPNDPKNYDYRTLWLRLRSGVFEEIASTRVNGPESAGPPQLFPVGNDLLWAISTNCMFALDYRSSDRPSAQVDLQQVRRGEGPVWLFHSQDDKGEAHELVFDRNGASRTVSLKSDGAVGVRVWADPANLDGWVVLTMELNEKALSVLVV